MLDIEEYENQKYGVTGLVKYCKICDFAFLTSKYKPNQRFCCFTCAQCFRIIKSARMRRNILLGENICKPKGYRKFGGRHEHRVVAELKLGRKLLPKEVVHHIDGNSLNNSPENLEVMTQAEHVRLHFTKNAKCSVIDCNKKRAQHFLCQNHWDRLRRSGKKGYEINGQIIYAKRSSRGWKITPSFGDDSKSNPPHETGQQ